MDKDPFPERLKRLENRIAAAKAARAEPERGQSEFTQGSLAWRMVTELVAGMGLGIAVGFGLDWLFGTRPVFLVLFALLGFAAGVRTMLRTADEVRHGRAEGALMRPGAGPDKSDPAGRDGLDGSDPRGRGEK
ncbi:AtpZ/AtpI family protein [Amaricoccus sp.]|uniref:AtpZ/AtpI family protein n=1 Tax=Amaricoccus sp. TaxID=1872485 RepID=UPI002601CD51|nr:AtpZ/AtpI family protein [uncultured Amaricoccus sp.]